jgi:cyanophycinase
MATKKEQELLTIDNNKNRPPASGCPTPKGKLLAIGGSENKGSGPKEGSNQENNLYFTELAILERFGKELRGENPLIAVLPTASSVPEESGNDYVKAFKKLGFTNVHMLDIQTRSAAELPENIQLLEQAAGVMFTGGDQLKLTSILGGTTFTEKLKERYTFDHFIIAGTSAGAAALSTPMIYSGKSEGGFMKGDVYITTGLEFMRDVAIDTHFISRGRISRMIQAIATNPQCIGIGLEEDTAILFTEGRYMEVLGSGVVIVVDGMDMTDTNIYNVEQGVPITVRGLKVHMLGKGEHYELPVYEQYHK